MTALAIQTTHRVDDVARPQRWRAPRRRRDETPTIKAGPEQTARRFVRELAERFCRWPGAYCLWPTDATLADVLEITPDQLRYRLRLAERFGLIRRHPSLDSFDRWLELEGVPDHGLDPMGPRNLEHATRVIVVLDLLPARIRAEGLYAPLGLDIRGQNSTPEGANLPPQGRQNSTPEGGEFTPRPPIRESSRENEVETNKSPDLFGFFAPLTDEEEKIKTPTTPPKPIDPWEALDNEERERRRKAVATKRPELAKFEAVLAGLARAEYETEKPELFADLPKPQEAPRKPEQPISQGKPRRTQGAPKSDEPSPSRRQWAEELNADVQRLTVVYTHDANDMDNRVRTLAENFGKLFNDKASVPTVKARIWEVIDGGLAASCFADAVREAIRPSSRCPGAVFSFHVTRYRAAYVEMHESEAAGRLHSPK